MVTKAKVYAEIVAVFPNLPSASIDRLANLIVSSCGEEAVRVARSIPRRTYGSFRLDTAMREWIML